MRKDSLCDGLMTASKLTNLVAYIAGYIENMRYEHSEQLHNPSKREAAHCVHDIDHLHQEPSPSSRFQFPYGNTCWNVSSPGIVSLLDFDQRQMTTKDCTLHHRQNLMSSTWGERFTHCLNWLVVSQVVHLLDLLVRTQVVYKDHQLELGGKLNPAIRELRTKRCNRCVGSSARARRMRPTIRRAFQRALRLEV